MSNSALPDLNVGTLFSQEGKVVVITGGGTGLGLMMATAFVQNGAKVVYIASRKLKNLEGAAKMLNGIREGSAVPLEADLTTAKGCQALGDEIKQRESTVDVLINNSGVSWGSEMESTDEKKGWDRVFDVNVKSLFYLTVALLPLLEKNTSPSSPASVINISSIYGSLPFANMPTLPVASMGAWSYLASKAAASHLTRTLSVKLKPRNVNVNALAPGFFPSNMTSTARDDSLARSHPAGLAGEAKDIAAPALLLAGSGGAHLSGITITTDGGASLVPPHVFPKDIAKLHMPPERFERLLAKL